MVGGILIAAGIALMVLGASLMAAWLSGKARWFDREIYDRPGDTLNDRQFIRFYFIALVLAPLLGGGIMIVFGLKMVL